MLSNTIDGNGLGWRRDLPDFRDYTPETSEVNKTLKQGGALRSTKAALPSTVDLRQWCSPVENQRQLGSCTANAGVGLVEYFQNKANGIFIDASRLFLYKATRNLMKETGDTGGYLRETMKALVLFGVPPEEYWPYTDNDPDFDVEPPAFLYAFGQQYNAIKVLPSRPPCDAGGRPARKYQDDLSDTAPCDVRLYRIQLYQTSTSRRKDPHAVSQRTGGGGPRHRRGGL